MTCLFKQNSSKFSAPQTSNRWVGEWHTRMVPLGKNQGERCCRTPLTMWHSDWILDGRDVFRQLRRKRVVACCMCDSFLCCLPTVYLWMLADTSTFKRYGQCSLLGTWLWFTAGLFDTWLLIKEDTFVLFLLHDPKKTLIETVRWTVIWYALSQPRCLAMDLGGKYYLKDSWT